MRKFLWRLQAARALLRFYAAFQGHPLRAWSYAGTLTATYGSDEEPMSPADAVQEDSTYWDPA